VPLGNVLKNLKIFDKTKVWSGLVPICCIDPSDKLMIENQAKLSFVQETKYERYISQGVI
jgi:hypothetical protein